MTYLKRPAVIRNSIFFCILSLFFLSVVESLEGGVSALDLKVFLTFLKSNKLLVSLSIVSILSIATLKKASPYIFLVYCSMITFNSLSLFFIDFDKLILIENFFYILFSYNFFLFLKIELSEPFYNPKYTKNILPDYLDQKFPIELKKNGKSQKAYLTNWGENGFFCRLDDSQNKLKGKLEIESCLSGHSFFAEGEVMSRGLDGVGIRVSANPVPHMGWINYYGIISEQGMKSL